MRTKGATSCIAIRLEDLKRLAGKDSIILIARKQFDVLTKNKPVTITFNENKRRN